MRGKEGWSIDRIKRELNLEDYAFNRKLSDMMIDRCPQKELGREKFSVHLRQGHKYKTER